MHFSIGKRMKKNFMPGHRDWTHALSSETKRRVVPQALYQLSHRSVHKCQPQLSPGSVPCEGMWLQREDNVSKASCVPSQTTVRLLHFQVWLLFSGTVKNKFLISSLSPRWPVPLQFQLSDDGKAATLSGTT